MKKIVLMVMMAMAVLTTNAQSEYPTSLYWLAHSIPTA